MYLHDLITYSSTKYRKMLSGLFPINTNSLISFHEQYSVLLHQITTLKELLSLLSSVDTIENALNMQMYPPCCYYSLNVVILLVHLWLWINNYSWTRTTLQSNNNTNVNKKISQFMYINIFVVVVVTMSFCSFSYVMVDGQWQMNNNNNNNNIITPEQQQQQSQEKPQSTY